MDPLIRKLRKKLRQVEALERSGRDLSTEESKKVARKDEIRAELQTRLQESKCEGSGFLSTDESSSVLMTGVSTLSSDSTGLDTSFGSCIEGNEPKDPDDQEQPLQVVQTGSDSHRNEEFDAAVRAGKDTVPEAVGTKVLGDVHTAEVSLSTSKKSRKKTSEKKRVQSDADVLRSGKFAVRTLEGHNDAVLAVDCDVSLLVTGSVDTMVKVWNADSGEELKSFGGHEGAVTSVVIIPGEDQLQIDGSLGEYEHSQENRLVISGSLDCTFRLWNIDQGLQLNSVYTFSPLKCVRYSSKKVLTGSVGGKLDVWDAESCQNVGSVRGHDAAITALWFDFPSVVSGDAIGSITVWSVHESSGGACQFQKQQTQCLDKRRPDPSEVMSLPVYHYAIHSLCVNMAKSTVYWGDNGVNVKYWNMKTGKLAKLPNHVECWGSTNAITLCGPWIVAGGYNLDSGLGYLTVRNVEDNSYVTTLSCPDCPCIECLACWTPSGANSGWQWCTGGKRLKTWHWLGPDSKLQRTKRSRAIVSPATDSRFELAQDTETESESEQESDEDSDEHADKHTMDKEDEQSYDWSLKNWCNIL